MAETLYDGDDNPAERAFQRIVHDEELWHYQHILFDYEWPEGDAHLEWVASAPRAELLAWAAMVNDAEVGDW